MMSEPISAERFYEALQILERRLGEKIDWCRCSLETKLDEHAEDDRKVADRVLTIEIQRADEKAQALKRGVWAGIGAASGVSLLIEGLRHLWKP